MLPKVVAATLMVATFLVLQLPEGEHICMFGILGPTLEQCTCLAPNCVLYAASFDTEVSSPATKLQLAWVDVCTGVLKLADDHCRPKTECLNCSTTLGSYVDDREFRILIKATFYNYTDPCMAIKETYTV